MDFVTTPFASGDETEVIVGRNIRTLRISKGYSLRVLASRSNLNINTLSLIENGKSSPSVGTLQQLALALDVPITSLFKTEPVEKKVVLTRTGERPEINFGTTKMQNLSQDLAGNAVQAFVVSLNPGMGSGDKAIIHTGHELVYCITGVVRYRIENEEYILNPGDSLLFEAHLPHSWENHGNEQTQILLVLSPKDVKEELGARHFSLEYMTKELRMKIAVITDDGKTISQHFGRAQYYLVLTIEEGTVVEREMRSKMGHSHFVSQHNEEETHGAGHGMDTSSHTKHVNMAETIADCKAIICGGMGMGAYESMRSLNIKPLVTDLVDVDAAVQAFIDGKLIDHTELLH